MDSSVQLSLFNAIAYTLVIPYWLFLRGFSLGVMIWILYAISAWFTYLFIQQPLYPETIHYGVHSPAPYIYLFILLYVFISPLSRIRVFKRDALVIQGRNLIDNYMFFMGAIQIISVLVDFPAVIDTLSSPMYELKDIRDEAYEGSSNLMSWSIPLLAQLKGWIQGPLNVVNNGLVIAFVACYKRKRNLVAFFGVATVLQAFTNAIVTISRGELFFLFVFWAIAAVLFLNYLNSKIIIGLSIALSVFLLIFVPFVVAISVSRFGESALFYIYKYFGEPMNNFNALLWQDIKGTTDGQAYFGFIHYLLGGEKFASVIDKWDFIEKRTNVSGQIFYTFVGGFVIEFGKLATVVIAIIFNRVVKKCLCNKKILTLGVYVLLMFFADFYVKGVFLFGWQGQNNLGLLYCIIIYIFFNNKYKYGCSRKTINQKI